MRGARRRYHTGDWKRVAKAVCSYEGNAEVAMYKQQEVKRKVRESSLHNISASDAITALEIALKNTETMLGTKY